MPSRDEFLRQVWLDLINPFTRPDWIDNLLAIPDAGPTSPFADAGDAAARLLAAGVDPKDLALVARWVAYETAFSLLYMLDDPGVDNGDVVMLHESLLGADPSGLESRPGSAPRAE